MGKLVELVAFLVLCLYLFQPKKLSLYCVCECVQLKLNKVILLISSLPFFRYLLLSLIENEQGFFASVPQLILILSPPTCP